MHVLITGAGGYIGTVLVEEALKAGHKVVALDRFFFGEDLIQEFAKFSGFHALKKDIREVTPADFAGVEVVMDLAALSNDPVGELDPELTRSINVRGRLGTASVAKAAGVKRYILASSCSVYGFNGNDVLSEESPTKPLTAYARSMLEAEEGLMALVGEDFCATVLRLATVFGLSRRMRLDLVVNTMTRSAIDTARIHIGGGGRQWRPLVHVSDVARCFMNVAGQRRQTIAGQIFNVGRQNYQIRALAYTIRENLPFALSIEMASGEPDHRSYRVSFDKALTVLGYEAQYDVAYGVREIYDAFKQGVIERTERTVTVAWYKHLLEAEQLVDQLRLNGRMI